MFTISYRHEFKGNPEVYRLSYLTEEEANKAAAWLKKNDFRNVRVEEEK